LGGGIIVLDCCATLITNTVKSIRVVAGLASAESEDTIVVVATGGKRRAGSTTCSGVGIVLGRTTFVADIVRSIQCISSETATDSKYSVCIVTAVRISRAVCTLSYRWVVVLKFRSTRITYIVETIESVASQTRDDSSSAGFDSSAATLAIT
jgi:hypothetical protein